MIINSLFIKFTRTNTQLINYQSVRWRRLRKPFWIGVAKSKKFIIPEPKEIRSPEDKYESELLKKQYSTQLMSILNFIQNDNPGLQVFNETDEEEKKMNPELLSKIEKSFKTNEEWNVESKKRREIRIKRNIEDEMKIAIEKISVEEKNREKHMEIIEKIVREEKLLSETYITPQNLDDAIEKCLNKTDCYDFAIDLEGNRYPGREVLPPELSNNRKISEEKAVLNISENSQDLKNLV